MKYFTNLVFDFRLNPFAMFSSGYNDTAVASVMSHTSNPQGMLGTGI